MTWVRLDDGFAGNPKIVALSDAAFRLWVSGLAYANANLTGGKIPTASLAAIPRAKPRTARELEEAGLWDRNGTGWLIHDYSAYQPSVAAEEARRAKHAEMMRAWRAKKAEA